MPNCPGDATLALVLEGTLPPAQRAAVVGHLDTCPECRALLADAIATGNPATGVPPATLASAVPDLPGTGVTIAGRYLLGAPLGRGGMGIVYEAVQLDLARTVAVKLLPPTADATAGSRFAREARTLAQLAHPSIVQIFDYGTDGAVAFVVMERLPGRNLAEAIRAEGRLDVGRSVQIASEMLVALGVAHAATIVHRDIKPANVFLVAGAPERVKLLDFGIAKTDDGSARLTETGTTVGTPAYMAPEQILAGALDSRTDLHAVGACLFEMLAGRRAFTASTSAEIVAQIVRGVAPRLDAIRPDVPTRLADVVERAMARDPNARYPSADAMLDALGPWRTGVAPMPAAATHAGMPLPMHPPIPSATHAGMPSATHAGMPSGMHAGVPSGMHAGVQSGMHAGMQSGMHAGVQSGMHAGMQPGMHAGMHAGMQPAMTAAPVQNNSRLWIILLASVLVTVVTGGIVAVIAFIKLSGANPPPVASAKPVSSLSPVTATDGGAGAGAPAVDAGAPPIARTTTGGAGGAASRAVPSVCVTPDNFPLCSQKFTTCNCRSADGSVLFPKVQTTGSIESQTVDAPGKTNGDACGGFTRGFAKDGTPTSTQQSGTFVSCEDCSTFKARTHPTVAVPGTPCRGVPLSAGGAATGVWQPIKP